MKSVFLTVYISESRTQTELKRVCGPRLKPCPEQIEPHMKSTLSPCDEPIKAAVVRRTKSPLWLKGRRLGAMAWEQLHEITTRAALSASRGSRSPSDPELKPRQRECIVREQSRDTFRGVLACIWMCSDLWRFEWGLYMGYSHALNYIDINRSS